MQFDIKGSIIGVSQKLHGFFIQSNRVYLKWWPSLTQRRVLKPKFNQDISRIIRWDSENVWKPHAIDLSNFTRFCSKIAHCKIKAVATNFVEASIVEGGFFQSDSLIIATSTQQHKKHIISSLAFPLQNLCTSYELCPSLLRKMGNTSKMSLLLSCLIASARAVFNISSTWRRMRQPLVYPA